MAKLSIAAALLLSVTVVAAQPFNDCDISTYYSNISPSKPRSELHTLLKSTHRDQLPYTSSSYGDVWDALIAIDSDDDERSHVKLVYSDEWVPSIPYDAGTCQVRTMSVWSVPLHCSYYDT